MPKTADFMPVEDVKAKYPHLIEPMISRVLELGRCIDDIEARLIREGKLKIKDGKYIWLNKKGRGLKRELCYRD